jgi:thiamine-phosphate pyrophosphorylase
VRGPKLIVVTDPGYPDRRVLEVIEAAGRELAPGTLGVQLRDKSRPDAELVPFVKALREATSKADAWLVFNVSLASVASSEARLALAKEVGADGVHLGASGVTIAQARAVCGAEAWISVAAHSDDAVRAAVTEGAQAALVSPVFPTLKTSLTWTPRGVEALASARGVAGGRLLLYALGGVTPENARACRGAGADGVAVIRAMLGAMDAGEAARAFRLVL